MLCVEAFMENQNDGPPRAGVYPGSGLKAQSSNKFPDLTVHKLRRKAQRRLYSVAQMVVRRNAE